MMPAFILFDGASTGAVRTELEDVSYEATLRQFAVRWGGCGPAAKPLKYLSDAEWPAGGAHRMALGKGDHGRNI